MTRITIRPVGDEYTVTWAHDWSDGGTTRCHYRVTMGDINGDTSIPEGWYRRESIIAMQRIAASLDNA